MAFVPLISLVSLHLWKNTQNSWVFATCGMMDDSVLPRKAPAAKSAHVRGWVSARAGLQPCTEESTTPGSSTQSTGRSLFPLSHRVMREAMSSLLHRAPPCAACATVFLCVMKDLFRSLLPSVPNNGTWSTLRRSTASFPSLGLQLFAPAVLLCLGRQGSYKGPTLCCPQTESLMLSVCHCPFSL